MTTIIGKRVYLRPFEDPITDEECARVYRWSRDEALLRWSGGEPTDLTLDEFCKQLRSDHHDLYDNRRVFFIFTLNHALIGRIGCFAIDWDRREGELGIVIGESAEWSKGYGREAATLLLGHLFSTTRLERIYLFTYVENMRAQHSFAASGFHTRGPARHFSIELGDHEGIEMEITRGEFLQRGQNGQSQVR